MAKTPRVKVAAAAAVPMRTVGPIRLTGPVLEAEVTVPLATFETPLWPSVNRGARVTAHAGGICAVIADERMTRSILLEAPDAVAACAFVGAVAGRHAELEEVVRKSDPFVRLIGLHHQVLANLVYLRLEMHTGDAAGHNMTTLAADRVMDWLLEQFPNLRYISISGNYCTDKKVSAVNGILGRGKQVITEALIPEKLCRRYLKTSPGQIVELNIKKNLIGSLLSGSVRSANAHFANMLLAFYLATGQDAANIIEGSQGIVHAEERAGGLYFSCTLPNIIVGTVGNGKEHDFVQRNLELLDCLAEREAGENARRLAAIAGAVVLCGELSLLAAETNPGELMAAHLRLERHKKSKP